MRGELILLGLVTFVCGWLVPGHFPPWTAFQQQWAAALGVALIALGAASNPRLRWRWPLSALVLLGLAAMPLVQHFTGQILFRSDAVLSSLFIGGFALSVATGANLATAQPQQWADRWMTALLVAASVSSGLALAQWLRWDLPYVPHDPLPPGARPYANLAQANHLASLLALGLAATLHLFERRRVNAVVASLVCAWLALGLAMTQSRTGWLFVGTAVLWWLRGRQYLRLRFIGVAAFCAAFVAAVLCWSVINRELDLPAPATLSERSSTGLRVRLGQTMLEAIGRSPWVGWGWNQVSMGQLAVAFDHEAGQRAMPNAHSILLDLPLWMGIPLAVVLTVLALVWLVRRVRVCNDGPRWSLLLAVAAIGVHALTEYPLDYSYFLLTLGLLVGTLDGLMPTAPSVGASAWTFLGPWTIVTAMLVWVGVDYMKVEESARQVRMVIAGVGLEKQSFVPPPDTALLDGLREYHRLLITPARARMSDAELGWMRDVMSRNPTTFVMLRYAQALGMNGRGDESARVLRALCNMQTPKRCQQARESWNEAQQQHPELASVPAP